MSRVASGVRLQVNTYAIPTFPYFSMLVAVVPLRTILDFTFFGGCPSLPL